ncbi:30S ribosomal protein S12 methylthiotransferase RimO [Micrococcales bacterium 31B]|nr:30S ribosomal protein S12 methylthiotransferase RimO [Micrococcales bacterium 31B]
MTALDPTPRSVALVTLGCVRNEVDSEELAGRLAAAGWNLVDDAADADVAVVNTCGFVEQAKKDSVDALLEASQLKGTAEARTQAVVAVGCMAERYGQELAEALPEADAVLGFDSYQDLSKSLTDILQGERPASHVPVDRRTLLPVTPVQRQAAAAEVALPGHGVGAAVTLSEAGEDAFDGSRGGAASFIRKRLDGRPWAPIKLASGCDRRCTFCAIPMFRGAFVSRPQAEVLAEARWLAAEGVRELFLVSENSTSYGKDLSDVRALEGLLADLTALDGIDRVRVSYLQPAEVRPTLLEAMATTPGVAAYYDLSFQHAAPTVLRRMRRYGGSEPFLNLIAQIRERQPEAGLRTNVIVGFPGETEAEYEELKRFLIAARLDVTGVFGYSDEDGTEAATLPDKIAGDVIARRVEELSRLVEELNAQRAQDRIGAYVDVIVEGETDRDDLEHYEAAVWGRAEHQGPEVDGIVYVRGRALQRGDLVRARVVEAEGVDLIAELAPRDDATDAEHPATGASPQPTPGPGALA